MDFGFSFTIVQKLIVDPYIGRFSRKLNTKSERTNQNSRRRRLFIIFFFFYDIHGIVYVNRVSETRTVHQQHYLDVLEVRIREKREKYPNRGNKRHGYALVACVVCRNVFLAECKITVLGHPPCSQCNIRAPKVENALNGTRSETVEVAKKKKKNDKSLTEVGRAGFTVLRTMYDRLVFKNCNINAITSKKYIDLNCNC